MQITIELTEAEYKGLAYVAVDPAEWVQNAATVRAKAGMEELFQAEVEAALANPATKSIPADREAVVLASTLPSASERELVVTPEAEPEVQ
jgi:hypothetical protein